ncbi:hypothetical protein E4T56_gene8786 [Termitomyces sp. T112]|nr:hypothetical protein E4T56_gene8786 [Termitomyces sp. T112]
MAPRLKVAKCEVCSENQSKYTCSACFALYCSVPCFKRHKETSCSDKPSVLMNEDTPGVQELSIPTTRKDSGEESPLEELAPLRPLTSLKWPYIPDESAYPDPLQRDDPKTLQLHQYEAIATSPSIRKILAAHPNLKALLTSIDSLRGNDREHALQRALGVSAVDIKDIKARVELGEDVLALRELAEAVEVAVRGGRDEALGLDWDSSEI